jgi:enoyl-CoA hydratase/carnithine racemase
VEWPSDTAGVARVFLARPEQRNAVSTRMLEDLVRALGDLAADPEVRSTILGGDGPDFCSGADLGELAAMRGAPEAATYGAALEDALAAIAAHPVPVIARVQGVALGAGCQLVVACDLAVAAEDARLGIPSSRLGIVIAYESIERLVLAVGPKRAAELLQTGREISGPEAARWGLVNRAVPGAELSGATEELGAAVAAGAPLSTRATKRGIAAAIDHLRLDRFSDGHRVADFDMMAAEAFGSDDLREGLEAARERRRPRFRGK